MSTLSTTPPPTSGLSKFMDRRSFLRTGAVSGAGLYLATSKSAIAQGTTPGRTVKCALVGLGAQGDRLRAAASQIKTGIEWVAICDIREDKRRQVGAYIKLSNKYQFNGTLNAYETIEEMLEKQTDIEAVFIATPDFLHAPFSRMCLEKGKSVYCEKMMSNTIEGARDMVKAGQAARPRHPLLRPVEPRRHRQPPPGRAKEKSGHPGAAGQVRLRQHGGVPELALVRQIRRRPHLRPRRPPD